MKREGGLFYGWVILLVSVIAMIMSAGTRNSFSVIYVAILEEFSWSRAQTASIFSIHVACYGFLAPVVGALVDRYGPRRVLIIGALVLGGTTACCAFGQRVWQFYLLFGLGAAIGFGLVGLPALIPGLMHWFIRRRALAFGLFASGFGLSFLVIGLTQALIDFAGWRLAFLVLGCLVIAVLIPLIGLLYRGQRKPAHENSAPVKLHRTERSTNDPEARIVDVSWTQTTWTLKRAMRTSRFWMLFFSVFCLFGFTENLLVVHQVALMRDTGFGAATATMMVFLWGIFTALGNLLGTTSDHYGRERTFTVGAILAMLGVLSLSVTERYPSTGLLFFAILTSGAGLGIAGPCVGTALADLFHGRHFGAINGSLMMAFGLGGLLAPWLGGAVFDWTRHYTPVLLTAAFLIVAAMGAMWIAAPRKVRLPG